MTNIIFNFVVIVSLIFGICAFILIYRLFWRLAPSWYHGKDPRYYLSSFGLLANRIIIGGFAAIFGSMFIVVTVYKVLYTVMMPVGENIALVDAFGKLWEGGKLAENNKIKLQIKTEPKINKEENLIQNKINNEVDNEKNKNKNFKDAEPKTWADNEIKIMEDKVQYHGDDPIIRRRLGLPDKE